MRIEYCRQNTSNALMPLYKSAHIKMRDLNTIFHRHSDCSWNECFAQKWPINIWYLSLHQIKSNSRIFDCDWQQTDERFYFIQKPKNVSTSNHQALGLSEQLTESDRGKNGVQLALNEMKTKGKCQKKSNEPDKIYYSILYNICVCVDVFITSAYQKCIQLNPKQTLTSSI